MQVFFRVQNFWKVFKLGIFRISRANFQQASPAFRSGGLPQVSILLVFFFWKPQRYFVRVFLTPSFRICPMFRLGDRNLVDLLKKELIILTCVGILNMELFSTLFSNSDISFLQYFLEQLKFYLKLRSVASHSSSIPACSLQWKCYLTLVT